MRQSDSQLLPVLAGMGVIESINLQTHLLSVNEVCALLGVHKETVRRWIRAENFPAFRVGRQFRSDPNQVAEWLKSRRT